ncbi:partial Glycerol-3-phosphate dehydrogenase [NAD(P)+], partial [Myxococcaceae bacterium]
QEILAEMSMVAEGVATTQSAYGLARKVGVEVPIIEQVHRILFEEADHPPRVHACVLRFEEALAHALESSLRARGAGGADPDTCAHLIVQTTEALAHRFVLRGIHDLDREAFIEQTTRLLAGYAGSRPIAMRRRSR